MPLTDIGTETSPEKWRKGISKNENKFLVWNCVSSQAYSFVNMHTKIDILSAWLAFCFKHQLEKILNILIFEMWGFKLAIELIFFLSGKVLQQIPLLCS